MRALNSLQKSIALRPLEPRTGPMGGEGVAWAAGQMNFTAMLGNARKEQTRKETGKQRDREGDRAVVEDWRKRM